MHVVIVLGNTSKEVMRKRVKRAVKEFNHISQTETTYLLLSGGVSKPTEAEQMKDIAMDMGIPSEFILTEEYSTNTISNIKLCKKYLEVNFMEKPVVTICTSAFHIKRTLVLTKMFMGEYDTRFVHTKEDVTDEEYEREEKNILYSIGKIWEDFIS